MIWERGPLQPPRVFRTLLTEQLRYYLKSLTYESLFFINRFQWRIQGRVPGGLPLLCLDQTEAQRAEKNFF